MVRLASGGDESADSGMQGRTERIGGADEKEWQRIDLNAVFHSRSARLSFVTAVAIAVLVAARRDLHAACWWSSLFVRRVRWDQWERGTRKGAGPFVSFSIFPVFYSGCGSHLRRELEQNELAFQTYIDSIHRYGLSVYTMV